MVKSNMKSIILISLFILVSCSMINRENLEKGIDVEFHVDTNKSDIKQL